MNLTWREQVINLNENAPTEIYFNDTEPNHIVFNNPTSNAMYISVSPNVSPNSHEMLVAPGGTKMYARMNGLKQIYIYHSSAIIETIRVVSFTDTFTPQSIAQSSEIVNVQELTGEMNVVSLPALPEGAHNIGKVIVTEMPSLPAGSSLIGEVDIPNGVHLSGSGIPDNQAIPMRNAGMLGLANGSLVIPSTATELKVGVSQLVGRKQMVIYPPDAGIIYWGTGGVTIATGLPLASTDSPISFDFDPSNPLSIYACSDGTDRTIKVGEIA